MDGAAHRGSRRHVIPYAGAGAMSAAPRRRGDLSRKRALPGVFHARQIEWSAREPRTVMDSWLGWQATIDAKAAAQDRVWDRPMGSH
jgi:hypothetical protein